MARVKINRTRSRAYARDWAEARIDPVTTKIQLTAKAMVPVKTGLLRLMIVKTKSRSPLRVSHRVGSRVNYSLMIHRGARPHEIVPRRKGGRLVFFWRKVGRVVSLPSVNHPGFQGTNYLTAPLVAHATAAGFRVVITGGLTSNLS